MTKVTGTFAVGMTALALAMWFAFNNHIALFTGSYAVTMVCQWRLLIGYGPR